MSTQNDREAVEKSNVFPWKRMSILLLAQFTNSFSIRVIFPILPFMTHDFFPQLNSSQIGFYAGFLGCIFSCGGLIGGISWGRIADIYGRRPVLLLGILGAMLAVLTFGFSINFAMAMISRFLWGLLNGNIGVVKAYMAEICTDETQARGFSFIGLSGALGRLVGPIVSGLLSCPAVTYEALNVALLREFPYLLPCLFCVLISLLCLLGTFFFLPETLQLRKTNNHPQNNSVNIQSDVKEYEDIEETTPLLHDCENSHKKKTERSKCCSQPSFIFRIFKDKAIMLTISIYGLIALIGIISAEVLPLLLITDSKHGGFNFDASEISFLYILLAIPEILNQIFISPRLVKKIGYIHLLRTSLIVSGLTILLYPFLSTIVGPIPTQGNRNNTVTLDPYTSTSGYFQNGNEVHFSSEKNMIFSENSSTHPQPTTTTVTTVKTGSPWSDVKGNLVIRQCHFFSNETSTQDTSLLRIPIKAWVIITSIVSFSIVFRVMSFTCIATLINNSCLSEDRATVNGLSQSCAAFSRALGPAAFSNFFAWTENNNRPWPLNYHLTFYTVSFLSFVTVFISCFLPNEINKKKVEEN